MFEDDNEGIFSKNRRPKMYYILSALLFLIVASAITTSILSPEIFKYIYRVIGLLLLIFSLIFFFVCIYIAIFGFRKKEAKNST